MKVLNLRCANGHGFEGWFGSDEDFMGQNGAGLIECPMCADKIVTRMPSAPRLNLSGAREVVPAAPQGAPGSEASQPQPQQLPQPADLHAAWLHAARELMRRTEDVGQRFSEEARRIHYGEAPERGIRGEATPEQREALAEEGIEVFAFPLPRALKEPLQ
jgi:hypothetical protein